MAHLRKGDVDAELLFYYRGRENKRKVLACINTDLEVDYTDNLPFKSAEVNKAMLEALYKKLLSNLVGYFWRDWRVRENINYCSSQSCVLIAGAAIKVQKDQLRPDYAWVSKKEGTGFFSGQLAPLSIGAVYHGVHISGRAPWQYHKVVPFPAPPIPFHQAAQGSCSQAWNRSLVRKVFLALAVSTQAGTLQERERNVLINYKTDTETGAKGWNNG